MTKRLLVAQRCHRIEARGAIGREESEKISKSQRRSDANNGDIARYHFRGNLRKLVNLFRKNLDVQASWPAND